MSTRLAVCPAPVPLETFAAHFDPLFSRRNQRESFRRYLEGLLRGQERNKTLTALANAEPVVGALHASVQSLQCFLSESCRERLLRENTLTAPTSASTILWRLSPTRLRTKRFQGLKRPLRRIHQQHHLS